MRRRKGEAINPDAIAKSLIIHHNLVTQKDLAKLKTRLDRIENQLKAYGNGKFYLGFF